MLWHCFFASALFLCVGIVFVPYHDENEAELSCFGGFVLLQWYGIVVVARYCYGSYFLVRLHGNLSRHDIVAVYLLQHGVVVVLLRCCCVVVVVVWLCWHGVVVLAWCCVIVAAIWCCCGIFAATWCCCGGMVL